MATICLCGELMTCESMINQNYIPNCVDSRVKSWSKTIWETDSHCDFSFLLLHRADDLSSDLCLQGVAVQSLHGDREQSDREEALQDFRDGMLVSSK